MDTDVVGDNNTEQEKDDEDDEQMRISSPSWMCPVNVESLLPSHTIVRTQETELEAESETDTSNVNSGVEERAQTPPSVKCSGSADKICDVSPLDNLLAVAELEFNQQIQSGEWNKTTTTTSSTTTDESQIGGNNNDTIVNNDNEKEFNSLNDIDASVGDDDDEEHQKQFFQNMEHLSSLIESCSNSKSTDGINKLDLPNDFDTSEQKSDDCDYNEDDDNNLAMDDILSRLEQSLRSPECSEMGNVDTIEQNCDLQCEDTNNKTDEKNNMDCFAIDINENNYKSVPDDEFDKYFKETESTTIEEEQPKETITTNEKSQELDKEIMEENVAPLVESSTIDEEPTDLSVKGNNNVQVNELCNVIEEPTDLTIPKCPKSPQQPVSNMSRPPSQNSEAIQSPQPSGIPAVPQSPDIVSPSANSNNKTKTVFLESLLMNSTGKLPLNSEVTIMRQKEPLDLGKCRKSASPTVTCSQEINNTSVSELEPPPTKRFKEDVTLKHLLVDELQKAQTHQTKIDAKSNASMPETPKLLELLKTDSEPDPLTQLRQLLTDQVLNVPDPMLVPKEKLSSIISHPGREIPKLLKQRPELRLPEALAFPHLLQDPDILVITLQQLETIIMKQGQSHLLKDMKPESEKVEEKSLKRIEKINETVRVQQRDSPTMNTKKKVHESSTNKSGNASMKELNPGKCNNGSNNGINELANEIDAATTAAFNQMMWLPYLNHLEAMSFGNTNTDIIKMLTSTLPLYQNQVPDLSHLFANKTPFPSPVGFPLQQPLNYTNPLELSMWQEAMLQANMLRPKNPFENFNPKHPFRDYLDKIPLPTAPKKQSSSSTHSNPIPKQPTQNHFYPTSNSHSSYQNQYLNMPAAAYQANNSIKQNLQVPQFSSHQFPQKNPSSTITTTAQLKSPSYSSLKHLTKMDATPPKPNFSNFYSHHNIMEDKLHHHYRHELSGHPAQRPKVACKSFANVSHQQQKSLSSDHLKPDKSVDFSKHHHHHHQQQQQQQQQQKQQQQPPSTTTQPIDLSGSTVPVSKLKVKQHLIDPVNTPKLLKHDDVAEVGSTTASIEEMQDAHKHLWHPLFGKYVKNTYNMSISPCIFKPDYIIHNNNNAGQIDSFKSILL